MLVAFFFECGMKECFSHCEQITALSTIEYTCNSILNGLVCVFDLGIAYDVLFTLEVLNMF